MRRLPVALLAGAMAGASLLAATAGVSAASGQVSAQYQAYSATSGGQDPYANSNPLDVHVDGYGGQPVVTGYVLLNLDSLPTGSNIDGLTLSLTPNSSQSDNVNASAASIEACVLTSPLTGNGYQTAPPSSDCLIKHAIGELQTNGDWHFDIAPIAQYWSKNQNDGLALIAFPPANDANVPVAPTAWSIGFDHTKTTAAVDYSPGSSTTLVVPPPAQSSSGSSFSVPPPSVVSPVQPAVLPSSAAATTAPSAAAGAAAAPAPAQSPVVGGTAGTSSPRLAQQWIWLTVALGVAALLLLTVGASQQLLRGGRLNLGAAGAALAGSRSQMATPIATLAVGAVLALGFSGQLVSSAAGGSGLAGGSGVASSGISGTVPGTGPGASGGGAAPGTAPGSAGRPGGSGSTGPRGSGAAVASNGNTNGGNNGVGVTATTVRIGFVYQVNSQAANQTFGFNVASTGDQKAEAQALVNYVNGHGGIGGRQILPSFASYDVAKAESDPNVETEICRTLTEDDHVFAVVAGGGPNGDLCYAQHGTINFDATYTAPDLAFLQSASPYLWATEAASLDRGMRWEMAGLASRNFFSGVGPANVGVLVANDPVNARVYNQVTLPALQAAGISNPHVFTINYDTESDLANNIKQAVVNFQANGVTNVIFQGGGSAGGGSFAILFMVNAESQHYNPRYGLGSSDAPVALFQNVPQDQFTSAQGPALAVGELASTDTDETHYLPWPSTPNEKTCASIEAAAGNPFTSREGALAILALCNGVFELQQGAQGLTTLNAQVWADHAMQLGSSVFNDSVYRATVGPQHWDAAAGYRLLHAVQNCETSSKGQPQACFEYDNSNVYGG